MVRRQGRIEGRNVGRTRSRMDQKGYGERQHDQQFESAQQRSHSDRELDPVVRECPYNGKSRKRDQPPWDVQPEGGPQHV